MSHGEFVLAPRSAPGGRVVLDPVIAAKLHGYQREGCKILYDACMGAHGLGRGCVLADAMGLGKTFTTLALIHTVLAPRLSYGDSAQVQCAVVICPVQLVLPWQNEISKLFGVIPPHMVATVVTSDQNRDYIHTCLQGFRRGLLILSYDVARMFRDSFRALRIGLLVCDEAHRLKVKSALHSSLTSLSTEMRLLITSTPASSLRELHVLLTFCLPGCFGDPDQFDQRFSIHIERARDVDATEREIEKGLLATNELCRLVKPVILRRNGDVLMECFTLPEVVDCALFCPLTKAQLSTYQDQCASIVQSHLALIGPDDASDQRWTFGLGGETFTNLKRIINEPETLLEVDALAGDPNSQLQPSQHQLALNGKLSVMVDLLLEIKRTTDDKVVLLSSRVSTLDLFASVLAVHGLQYSRLGTPGMSAAQRDRTIHDFNTDSTSFAFLLSSKALLTGLELTGANRLILFDEPVWEPMKLILRARQLKPCYRYCLFAANTIDGFDALRLGVGGPLYPVDHAMASVLNPHCPLLVESGPPPAPGSLSAQSASQMSMSPPPSSSEAFSLSVFFSGPVDIRSTLIKRGWVAHSPGAHAELTLKDSALHNLLAATKWTVAACSRLWNPEAWSPCTHHFFPHHKRQRVRFLLWVSKQLGAQLDIVLSLDVVIDIIAKDASRCRSR